MQIAKRKQRKHILGCCYSGTLILAIDLKEPSFSFALMNHCLSVLSFCRSHNVKTLETAVVRFLLCHVVISQEIRKLKRLFPSWSVLLWSFWQPSCRLGCKHFRVVVHGLLKGAAHFGVLLPSIVCWTNIQTFFFQDEFCPHPLTSVSRGLEEQGPSGLPGYIVVPFLLNHIAYDNSTNLLSKSNVGSSLWAR